MKLLVFYVYAALFGVTVGVLSGLATRTLGAAVCVGAILVFVVYTMAWYRP